MFSSFFLGGRKRQKEDWRGEATGKEGRREEGFIERILCACIIVVVVFFGVGGDEKKTGRFSFVAGMNGMYGWMSGLSVAEKRRHGIEWEWVLRERKRVLDAGVMYI